VCFISSSPLSVYRCCWEDCHQSFIQVFLIPYFLIFLINQTCRRSADHNHVQCFVCFRYWFIIIERTLWNLFLFRPKFPTSRIRAVFMFDLSGLCSKFKFCWLRLIYIYFRWLLFWLFIHQLTYIYLRCFLSNNMDTSILSNCLFMTYMPNWNCLHCFVNDAFMWNFFHCFV